MCQRSVYRGPDGARSPNMVLFNKDAVVKTDAVVLRAATPHRVFLSEPQARDSLAGIQKDGFRAGNCPHHGTGGRRGTGEELRKVQSASLPG